MVKKTIKCHSLLVDGLRKVVDVRVKHKGAVQGRREGLRHGPEVTVNGTI